MKPSSAVAGSAAVEAQDLHFTYADEGSGQGREALRGLSFTAPAGRITGLLGPNGSGKSTTFKILSTQLEPSEGDARIFGRSIRQERDEVRAHLGVTFQSPSLDPHLSVVENLSIHASLFGMSSGAAAARIDELLKVFQLEDRRDSRVKQLSGGLARRAELAKALLNRPPLLLLDEPTTGLDPGLRYEFWRQLHRLKEQGVSLLVTTHLMDEADQCDELIFIAEGQVKAEGSPETLKKSFGADVLILSGISEAQATPWLREKLPPSARSSFVEGRLRIESPDAATLLPAAISHFGSSIQSLEWGRPTLGDVYRAKTGRALQ